MIDFINRINSGGGTVASLVTPQMKSETAFHFHIVIEPYCHVFRLFPECFGQVSWEFRSGRDSVSLIHHLGTPAGAFWNAKKVLHRSMFSIPLLYLRIVEVR